MFDLKWIRENPQDFDAGLARRGLESASAQILSLDAENRNLLTALQEMQARRNEASKAVGEAKRSGGDASISCYTRFRSIWPSWSKRKNESRKAKRQAMRKMMQPKQKPKAMRRIASVVG